MKSLRRFLLGGFIIFVGSSWAHADYMKGEAMFQIYGGGASLRGRYHQPSINEDEQAYADSGGVLGGQFLYFFHDSPCLAAGFDIFHSKFDTHESAKLLTNRLTDSFANDTIGLAILRASFP